MAKRPSSVILRPSSSTIHEQNISPPSVLNRFRFCLIHLVELATVHRTSIQFCESLIIKEVMATFQKNRQMEKQAKLCSFLEIGQLCALHSPGPSNQLFGVGVGDLAQLVERSPLEPVHPVMWVRTPPTSRKHFCGNTG